MGISFPKAYTDIQEPDAEIIREFVEKIIVYKAERVDGHRVQKIKIIRNCIGEFQTPTSHQQESMSLATCCAAFASH